MTRFDPNLRINRMVVERGGQVAYDERFHAGLNIVRGENSSGKSTVLNFIHYGLGGDVHEWSETALLCDSVTLEVAVSGKLVTISRPLSEESMRGMDFYFGDFEASRAADRSKWERYPYRRSQSRESFSQVLFRLLEIPEAANEDSGNITIHQVLRLLYGDQLSPIDEIFAHEGFDNPKTRDAVGRLLCGAFDSELYGNELQIRLLSKRFEDASAELNGLFRALDKAGHNLTMMWVEERRVRIAEEREAADAEISRLKLEASAASIAPTLRGQESAYAAVVDRQLQLAVARQERDAIDLEVQDSAAFIESLESKLQSLKDAALVAMTVGVAHFTMCPACYRQVATATEGRCGLCKESLDPEEVMERLGGLINETAQQLRQSKLLQEVRLEKLSTAESGLAIAESEWNLAAQKYSEVQKRPTNEQELRLEEQYKLLGYLQRQEEDLREKAKLIEAIAGLSTQKSEINAQLGALKARNEQLLFSQQKRLRDAYHAISENTRRLLTRDLKRQDSFEDPQKVDFSFAENKIAVDGHSYFSASSRAFLKSAFLFGFHMAACQLSYFRHPRFLMLDTIEDKGMEAARSQNFQLLVAEIVQTLDSEGQVILGTAMIAEELNNQSYVVGRFYTRDDRSLTIG